MAEAGEGGEWGGVHGLVKVNTQGGIMAAYFLVRQEGN